MSEEKSDDESEKLYSIVESSFRNQLSPDELKEVKKNLQLIMEASKELRRVKLRNWDEPYFIFKNPEERRFHLQNHLCNANGVRFVIHNQNQFNTS